MANMWTIDASRPDLAGLEVNPYIGYIGTRIYPLINCAEKTGTFYYKTLTTDSAAQTGRSVAAAPTATQLTDSSTTFSCAEAIKRYAVVPEEVKNCGGIEKADKMGAEAAKRSVARKLEGDIATQVFTGSATSITGAIIAGIETGANSVRRYPGKLAFICSQAVYQYIVKQTDVTGKLSYTFNVGGLDAADSLSVKSKLFLAMLQNIVGFDEVLIGDNDQWQPTGKADYAAIVKLPDPAEYSHKMDPVLGKTFMYLPDGNQPYEISSYPDKLNLNNLYTAQMWYNIKECNATAKYLVKGLYGST